ncbi:MAG: ABC-F family ATP-binding cassette domain-containing protein [Patescibacteria group bacterium]
MSLLSLSEIGKSFGTRTVLNGASLRVGRGDRVALIGANGSGKTTLLRIAVGLDAPDIGEVVRARHAGIGYLAQDFSWSGNGSTYEETEKALADILALAGRLRRVEAEMAAADEKRLPALEREYSTLTARFESLDGYTVSTRIRATLTGLGLREQALDLPMERLSGGEKMRVALARLLLRRPELLILDEPTNHLDLPATEWLEEFLRRFVGGVLVVSHDRYFLDRVATRVAELAGGRIRERHGNYATYIAQREREAEHVQDRQARLAREIDRTEAMVQSYKSKRDFVGARSKGKAAERLRRERAELLAGGPAAAAPAPRFLVRGADHVPAEVVKVEKLRKSFGAAVLFEEASFIVRGGDRVGIIGPNGCGKTTLLRILLGLDREYEGFARLGAWVRYGYLGQECEFADEGRTVLLEMEEASGMKEPEARNYLARFLFRGDDVHKTIGVLSGGERARLTLAKLLAAEPNCLILDEPTNHLDMPAREAFETALLGFDGTIIAVSHDRYFLNRCVTRILACEGGRIQAYAGNYELYHRKKLETERRKETAPAAGRNPRATQEKKKPVPAGVGRVEMERRIARLEARLKELEASFGQNTPYEDYREHERLTLELEGLYRDWEGMA